MTPLIIQTENLNNQYDNTKERAAAKRYFASLGKGTEFSFELLFNDKYDGIDARGTYKGTYYGVEIATTAAWQVGAFGYNLPYCYIPLRKWAHFKHSLYGPSTCIYDNGIYFLLSKDTTHAVLLNYKKLLNFDITDPDNIEIQHLNNEDCAMVKIPTTFIKKYVKIP